MRHAMHDSAVVLMRFGMVVESNYGCRSATRTDFTRITNALLNTVPDQAAVKIRV